MKKIIIIIVWLLALHNLHAQPNMDKKRDYNWFTGYESRNHNNHPIAGTTLMVLVCYATYDYMM